MHSGPGRIYLSPPHLGGDEATLLADAVASNWITSLGPYVQAFEAEFAKVTGATHALALSSGTAALHLALQLSGVGAGDEVMVSTLTFAATVMLWPADLFVEKGRKHVWACLPRASAA